MEIVIAHKYLVFPVNTDTTVKKICLTVDEQLLWDFDCKIDYLASTSIAYIDVSRFLGKKVKLSVTPDMEIHVSFSDEKILPGLWQERLRPKVHFTVQNGYNSDPNGCIRYGNTYHMFFQHNPCDTQWGNMHWGHAVSNDLIHWEEKDCALFPDELGVMFSGSAVEDKKGRSKFTGNGISPMLLFYTAAGNESLMSKDKEFTQCLAYSLDGGTTFQKYEKNPIVKHAENLNRDPKVVWIEEIKKYIMVIYLKDDLYQMYSSKNLLQWTLFQNIRIQGEKECPDLYSLVCDGEKKWILSGGADCYVVGHFNPREFVVDSTEQKLTYSSITYAGQSFSGMEDGRVVRIWWERNRTKFLDHRFSQQMGIPIEMGLEKFEGEYYLTAQPVPEIQTLYGECISVQNRLLTKPLRLNVGQTPLDIYLDMPYMSGKIISFNVFGATITINCSQNTVCFDNIKMPISLFEDRIHVRLIVDKCSIECFTDGGKFCFSAYHICDFNLPYIELKCSDEVQLDRLCCYKLNSIH